MYFNPQTGARNSKSDKKHILEDVGHAINILKYYIISLFHKDKVDYTFELKEEGNIFYI